MDKILSESFRWTCLLKGTSIALIYSFSVGQVPPKDQPLKMPLKLFIVTWFKVLMLDYDHPRGRCDTFQSIPS